MKKEGHEIYSVGGIKLNCISWQGTDASKAALFIVHGLGEHSGRYEEMADIFVENHFAVFAFDHRGHGRSEGKRGHASSLDQLIADVEQALMKCRSLFLDIPIIIFGHSMGGQIVSAFTQKMKSKEIAGAIISSTWFELVNPPPAWQMRLVNGIKRIIPNLTLSNKIQAKHITSVQTEVEHYKNDPLIHDRISFSLLNTLYHHGQRLLDEKKKIKVPMLVCHGDADKITSFQASKNFAEVQADMKTFKVWQGSFHEPHHDREKKVVVRYYIDWISERILGTNS